MIPCQKEYPLGALMDWPLRNWLGHILFVAVPHLDDVRPAKIKLFQFRTEIVTNKTPRFSEMSFNPIDLNLGKRNDHNDNFVFENYWLAYAYVRQYVVKNAEMINRDFHAR